MSDTLREYRAEFEDHSGAKLSRDEVETLAWDNIKGSMSQKDLLWFYINNISDDELLEWATDADGNFPNES